MMQFGKIIFTSSLIILSTGLLQAQIVVKAKPKRSKVVVVKPNKPGPNYIWIDGHWQAGPNNNYVWVAGSWVKARAGAVWVAGKWKRVRTGWRWIPGHWKKVHAVRTRG